MAHDHRQHGQRLLDADLRGISDNLTAGDHLLGLVQFKVGTERATPRSTSGNGDDRDP